jgi:hypothetical protein
MYRMNIIKKIKKIKISQYIMYRVILNFHMKRRIIKKSIDNTFKIKYIKKNEPNKNNINKIINMIYHIINIHVLLLHMQ